MIHPLLSNSIGNVVESNGNTSEGDFETILHVLKVSCELHLVICTFQLLLVFQCTYDVKSDLEDATRAHYLGCERVYGVPKSNKN